MEIQPNTKVNDLLNDYPQLEAFLMKLNPKYKKLKNPILRRTVAKIATLAQVAKIGGYETIELVNLLRKEVGQPPLNAQGENAQEENKSKTEIPEWATQKPKMVLNANKMLDENKNPLAEVSIALKKMESGETILIESDFMPAPLIDTFKEQGHEVVSWEAAPNKYATVVKK
jgi:TusA-related sulfurtransferase